MRKVNRTIWLARDDGSALVLALIFTTLISLIVAAVLSFASTSFQATMTLNELQGTFAAVDGAVEGAINSIRGNLDKGTIREAASGACPFQSDNPSTTSVDESLADGNQVFTSSLNLSPSGKAVRVDVKCKAGQDSGRLTGVVVRGVNAPSHAIIARAPSGTAIKQASSNTIVVGGDVYANTIVSGNPKSKFTVDGELDVKGTDPDPSKTCTKGFTSSLGETHRRCGPTALTPAFPNYPPPPTSTITTPGVVTKHCTSADSPRYVTFSPGKYSSVSALNDAAQECGKEAIYWFQPPTGPGITGPGVFYFEFDDVWRISGGQYVGGELSGTLADVKAAPLGTKCRVDTSDGPLDTHHGVEFVFGKKSSLSMTGGVMELCPEFSSSQQQISIYGLTQGGAQSVTSTFLANLPVPTSSPTGVAPMFQNPEKAIDIDGVPAKAQNIAGGQTSSLKFTFTTGATAIPDGASINSVTLHVVHRDSANTRLNLSAIFTPAGGGAPMPAQSINAVNGSGFTDYSKNLFDVDSTKVDSKGELIGATVDFNASVPVHSSNPTRTEEVDSIYLEVTYTPPGFAAGTCVAGASPACQLIDTSGNPNGGFLTHGTIYAPRADISLLITEENEHILSRGIDVNSLEVNKTGASRSTQPVISLPTDTTGTQNRTVFFTALVDEVPWLRARVIYTDFAPYPNVATPTCPINRACALNWSVIRPGAT